MKALKISCAPGLYQLKFSDRLPDFAVVDEAVKIAKKIAPAAERID